MGPARFETAHDQLRLHTPVCVFDSYLAETLLKPSFCGIGAHKCASTWVYRVLQEHPQAFVSQPKEICYFTRFRDKPVSWYENHFSGSAAEAARARGENSVAYFYDPEVPRRVHNYCPELMLVLTLRDPIQRAFSHHLFRLQLGELDMKHAEFEEGLETCPDYVNNSLYASHLERWLAVFPRDQILVLFQEDIAATPFEQAATLYRFLGLDPSHMPRSVGHRVNRSYLPRSRALKTTFSTGARLAEKLGQADLLWRLRNTKLVSRLLDLNKTDIRTTVPPMKPGTRTRFEKVFGDDVLETARLLGCSEIPWATWRHARKARFG